MKWGFSNSLQNSSACTGDLTLLHTYVFNSVLWTDFLFAFAPMIQYQLFIDEYSILETSPHFLSTFRDRLWPRKIPEKIFNTDAMKSTSIQTGAGCPNDRPRYHCLK